MVDIVRNYNFILYRSLNGLLLKEVNKKNEVDVWVILYLKNDKLKKERKLCIEKKWRLIKYCYKVNDLVRFFYLKYIFWWGYN